MSLERLKKYCERIAKICKTLTVIMIIIILCETVCFMWQALMPGKLNGFFGIFRIYAPFISDIDNNALCLYELAVSLFNNIFLFLMLTVSKKIFVKLSDNVSLSTATHEMKELAWVLIASAIITPIMTAVCYTVFLKLPTPMLSYDFVPVAVGGILYFIAVIIQSKAILKENRE